MFFETIKLENNILCNINFHQKRVESVFKEFSLVCPWKLNDLILPPDNGVYRCRFNYNFSNYSIEFVPYIPKAINSLKIVYNDSIDYHLKKTDRSQLNALFLKRDKCDDICIIKNGYITDTSIANLALFIDNEWFTPKTPLLKGTFRAYLLEKSLLKEKSFNDQWAMDIKESGR